MSRSFFTALIFVLLLAIPGRAQDLTALAQVLPARSSLSEDANVVTLRLGLSQGVPYRIFTLADPYRLIVDFNELAWTGLQTSGFDRTDSIATIRTGPFRPGWSRIVMELAQPLDVVSAGMTIAADQSADLTLVMRPMPHDDFVAAAGAPPEAVFWTGAEPGPPPVRDTGKGPLIVVLDPGHGGIDPGAENGDIDEADLILTFARELQEILTRSPGFEVHLTRTEDVFVPLEARVSIARAKSAHVFLSLHADALAEGRASGATIYTLSDRASDLASQKLAERHDRADLLAGVDLTQSDDVIAGVLMDLARTETAHRTDKLADALVTGLNDTVGTHKRPRLEAGFSVLKAPDIPSVLIELGFLSSPRDFENLQKPDWRQDAARGIRDALAAWRERDLADAALFRK